GTPFNFAATVTQSRTLYAGWQLPTGHTGIISVGGSVTGIAFNSTVKYYAFVPLVSGSYTMYSTYTSGDPYGILYNSAKTQLAYNDDYSSGYNFSITYSLTAGQLYYIGFRSYSSSSTGTGALYLTGTVTPSAGGRGSGAGDHGVLTFGEQFTLSVPTKSGYTFGGWWSGVGGTGIQYTDTLGAGLRPWDLADGAVLYAKWN
ncbi:MAG: hypothetical protein FWD58_10980, partial [Firmicutes bacterium]|nr:hypothetical protein [Bacillota bacterium]